MLQAFAANKVHPFCIVPLRESCNVFKMYTRSVVYCLSHLTQTLNIVKKKNSVLFEDKGDPFFTAVSDDLPVQSLQCGRLLVV